MATLKPTAENFKKHTLRAEYGYRGGGIEIDLTPFGFEGDKMTAYQNYLGGGMLGKICSDNTFIHRVNKVSHGFKENFQVLQNIEEELKRYFHSLTNHDDDEWESETYEQNQEKPASAY